MKSNGSAVVVLVFAVLVGYFTYQAWFNPSRAVKRRLGEVAAALSLPRGETEVNRMARLAQLRKFLASDIRVRIAESSQDVTPRDTVLALVSGFRPTTNGFDVRFTDMQVFVDSDSAAHAYMEVEVVTPDPQSGQPTIDSRNASVALAKVDGEWVLTTAEVRAPPRPESR
jgi:hypothetical protein